MTTPGIDLAAVRSKLAGRQGRQLWRSLDELAETPEFLALLHHEFPQYAAALVPGVNRRQFLRLMGASLGLAGLSACTKQPEEKIVPYVKQPEQLILGEPMFFATAMPSGGYATGVLVESHEYRPTKIEGNPGHPASLGGIDPSTQAMILGLYDPDRSQTVTSAGEIRTWGAFVDTLRTALGVQRARRGAGLRLLTETVTSPTLAAEIEATLADFPEARWHQWEPFGDDGARGGALLAFGEPVTTRYDLALADVVLTLDADLFGAGPARLRYAREIAGRRRPEAGGRGMNRLYAVESIPTTVGAMADHRLAVRASEIEAFARAVAVELGVGATGATPPLAVREHARWIAAVARDLQRHRGRSAVIPGEQQPPVVHALAHAMNAALGNVGTTVVHTEPAEARPVDQMASLGQLVADMDAGTVELLLILGGNPVFTAPVDLRCAERLRKVPLRVHLGLYDDETSELCHWHVNEAHPLEAWGDLRAYDGSVTIVQPLIMPLYDGRTALDVLAVLSGHGDRTSYDMVREHWRARFSDADFDAIWRKALHDGVVPGTAFAPRPVALRAGWDRGPTAPAADGLELVFRPDPYVGDGRFANNGWLMELPRPMTKLTWDNVALVSPITAERLGLANEEVVELRYQGRTLRAPLWVLPGHATDAITLQGGFGRRRGGAVANGAGVDAYALRTAAAPTFGRGLEVQKTGERHPLACTQNQQTMAGRPDVRTATLAEYHARPEFAREQGEAPPRDLSLYPPVEYGGYAWGMAIDLSTCIGCNACALACQAENNIPVVGKQQVAHGRVMHWIRVDRYFAGDLDEPDILHQPVPCMHCENAPCEVVCPVNATVHDSEGLNVMVYNRCVGTRYCSNNCPYKVRRFNFFLYQDWTTPQYEMMRNPQVTVRSRGVMEKCTYCVQRINRARITAEEAGRRIRDGELVTACQQACPADAIVFGDINDPQSRVAKLKADPRSYGLLAELGTRPRTTYLAGIRNPNPELEQG